MERMTVGTAEAAKQWGVSRDCVAAWRREKLIDATQDAKRHPWHIPVGTKHPYKDIWLQ